MHDVRTRAGAVETTDVYIDKAGKIADNIIDGLTALWYMSQASAIRRIPGAPSILVPLFYKKSSAHGFYRGVFRTWCVARCTGAG